MTSSPHPSHHALALLAALLLTAGHAQQLRDLKSDIPIPADAMHRQGYTLDAANLDLLYRRTAITALLRSRAAQELQQLPHAEAVVFAQCEQQARSPVQLAKCVRRLFRESARRRHFGDRSTEDWIRDAFRTETLFPDQSRAEKPAHRAAPVFPRPADAVRAKQVARHRLKVKYRKAQTISYSRTANNDRSVYDSRPGHNMDNMNASGYQQKVPLSFPHVRRSPYRRTRPNPKPVQYYQSISLDSDSKPTSPRCKTPENILNLRKVEKYFEKGNYCMNYLKRVGESNSRFLDAFQMSAQFKAHKPDEDSPAEQLKSVVSQIDERGLSFLSPKILNVLPQKADASRRPQFLSPTLLSFHDEGVLPLPRLLRLGGSDECEVQEWIDLLMDVSGASHKLRQMLDEFEKHIRRVSDELYPKIRELEKQDRTWERLKDSLSSDQKRAMDRYGYAKMSAHQLRLVYDPDEGLHPPNEFADDVMARLLSGEEDAFLDRLVEEMSDVPAFGNVTRTKRQTSAVPGLLAPYSLNNQVGMPSFLGNLILSPHAFINELFNPRFLGSDIISPRAFVATTLSPFAMVARVLAPAAFRVQTLSPQALTAIILTPEAFLAVILSPRALEVRVLSPETLSVAVLSPSMGMVRVLSPPVFNCYVLSPTILAANAMSTPKMNVEVLSPSILVADDGLG